MKLILKFIVILSTPIGFITFLLYMTFKKKVYLNYNKNRLLCYFFTNFNIFLKKVYIMKNVLKFNPQFQVEDWCYEELIYISKIQNYKFYNKSIYYKNYDVPLKKVIGTSHINYAGRKWKDLPYNMKRFRDDRCAYNYTIESFLNKIKSDDLFLKDNISYAKFGEQFIINGGNHRTCQAKFSNLESIKTSVTEYIFDDEMFRAFNFLKNEKLKPKIISNEKHYRSNSWELILNGNSIHFRNFTVVKKFITQYLKSKPSLLKNTYYKYFKNKPKFFFIGNDDFKQLEREIILHKYSKRNSTYSSNELN